MEDITRHIAGILTVRGGTYTTTRGKEFVHKKVMEGVSRISFIESLLEAYHAFLLIELLMKAYHAFF